MTPAPLWPSLLLIYVLLYVQPQDAPGNWFRTQFRAEAIAKLHEKVIHGSGLVRSQFDCKLLGQPNLLGRAEELNGSNGL